jgi:hypothetical protein
VQKALSAEIASLEKELAKARAELAKQKAKAIESCLKLDDGERARRKEQAAKLSADLFTVLSEGARLPPEFQDATSEGADDLSKLDLGVVMDRIGSLASARKPIVITRSSRLLDPPSTKKARRFREIVYISLRALRVPIALQPETSLTMEQRNFAIANHLQIVAKGTDPVPKRPAP